MKPILAFFMSFLSTFSLQSSPAALDPSAPIAHVIFDMGEVLVETSYTKVMADFGYASALKDFAGYFLTVGSPSKIKAKLYSVLTTLQPRNTCTCLDDQGDQLPELMIEWMTGKKTCAEIRSLVLPAIMAHREWFQNAFEQRLVFKTARMMFTPERFVSTRTLKPEAVSFVKKLVERGYRVHILSNWDAESFALLQKKYSSFFALFDQIIISGKTGILKPHSSSFAPFTPLLNNALPVFFIDDQKENIDAAKKAGITGLHLRSRSFKKVRKYFKWILLSETSA